MSFLETIFRPGHLSPLKTNVQQPKVTCNQAFKRVERKLKQDKRKSKLWFSFQSNRERWATQSTLLGENYFQNTQGPHSTIKKVKRNIKKNNNK